MPLRRRHISLAQLGLPGLRFIGLRQQTDTRREVWPARTVQNAIEIVYLASGRQTIRSDNHTEVLRGNDILINQPRHWHTLADDLLERCRVYYLSFDLAPSAPVLMLPPAESALLRRSLTALPRRLRGSPTTATLFDAAFQSALSAHHPAPHQGRRLFVLSAILSLVTHLLTLAERHDTPPKFSPPVARLRDHIARHITSTLDLPELAAVAQLSTSRLHPLFKRETGHTPREYVLRAKIDAAIPLLQSSRLSVAEVAAHLGFSSPQYFATTLKRYTGQSPRAFSAAPPRPLPHTPRPTV